MWPWPGEQEGIGEGEAEADGWVWLTRRGGGEAGFPEKSPVLVVHHGYSGRLAAGGAGTWEQCWPLRPDFPSLTRADERAEQGDVSSTRHEGKGQQAGGERSLVGLARV